MLNRFLCLLMVPLVLLASGCDNSAQFIYEKGLALEKYRAGLKDVTLTTPDGIEWHYLESEQPRPDQDVVLLIHGFGADASNWVRFANELEGRYHFIIPDLPGHGESTCDTRLHYAMKTQAQRLLQLMQTLGHEQFHVAGNSMGGGISMQIAAQAPQRVLSVGLLDSAGVALLTPEFEAMLAEGGNPLIPAKAEDMFTTLDWAMHDAPWLPDAFIEAMGKKKAENRDVALKIWHDLQEELAEGYDRIASTLTQPVLIMWGEKDRLLDVSSVPLLEKTLRNTETVIYQDIGHVPMVETPSQSALDLDTFWRKHNRYAF